MTNIIEQIRSAYRTERASGRMAVDLTEVPITYESITPVWLTKVLCRDTVGAEVVAYELGERNDATSNRRRIAVTYNVAGQAAKLPATVFCKMVETLENRVMLGSSGATQGETNFYNCVRARAGIETPVFHHAHFDPQSCAYILVMKDLAGEVTFCDGNEDVSRDMAVGQIELLATLHSKFYQSAELGTPTLPFRRFAAWWGNMIALAPDFESSCDRGFGAAERVIPPALFRQRTHIWSCTEQAVERHTRLPHTLIHSDVHLKNWYVTADHRMGLTDWHAISVGHWSRDLAYVMSTSLSTENRRLWEKDLLGIYLDRMAAGGVPRVPFDDAFTSYRQQLFTALAFWTITLRPAADFPEMHYGDTAVKFIGRIAHAIDDLDAMNSFK